MNYNIKRYASLGVILTGASTPTIAQQQPNIIYIFPDQFRNCSMGFWGDREFASHVRFKPDPVHTPNLNQLAKESVVLSEATSTCPVSSPHRGMLLTGMYPERNGVTLNCMEHRPESSLRIDAECISDVLSGAGYNCAYIGKLHVDYPTKNNPQNPGTYVSDLDPVWDAYTPPERRHNFDFWYSYGTFDTHKQPHYWDTEGNRHEIREWSPIHEVNKAIEYISNEQGVRDNNKPFLMMLSLNPPHSPYSSVDDCDSVSYELYRNVPIKDLLIRPNANIEMEKAVCAPYYFASVTGVDREIGRLLDYLKATGLYENTIIVFTSDHGETMCSHSAKDAKNNIYRESFNVPFLIRYPDKLTPRVDNLLLSTVDIMPTLLSLSGHADHIPVSVEGRDLSAAIKGEKGEYRTTAALYLRNLNGTRDKQTKLVKGIFCEARGLKSDRYTFEIAIDRKLNLKEVKIFDDHKDPYQLSVIDYKSNPKLFEKLCNELGSLLKQAHALWYRQRILSDIITY